MGGKGHLRLTWKFRPSGEKMELERSYPVPIDVYDWQEALAWQTEPLRATNHDVRGCCLSSVYSSKTKVNDSYGLFYSFG